LVAVGEVAAQQKTSGQAAKVAPVVGAQTAENNPMAKIVTTQEMRRPRSCCICAPPRR